MMGSQPLTSLAEYSRYIAAVLDRPTVQRSTVVVWSASPHTGMAEGDVYLLQEFRLRLREELDFEEELITAYGYEVYQGEQRLYWYDDFPHPNDLTLASTFPHHKHIPPDIKRHRIPAPEISVTQPNLSTLLQEIEALMNMATSAVSVHE